MDAPSISPELRQEADAALVRTVLAFTAAQWREPSLLPGWSRAHVVAHLALNAEGLEGAVTGAHTGVPRPMYDSDEARSTDIDELAADEPAALRDRLMAATSILGEALDSLTDTDRAATFERTPGGPTIHVGAVPLMRLREVEVHHVDLDAGHSADDWGQPFRAVLIQSMTHRPWPRPFWVLARDLAQTWEMGDVDGPVPTVSGDSAWLGWWLTGRGTGQGLTSDSGSLPRIEPW